LCLQLALRFTEGIPTGVLGDDLLWRRFDHAEFIEAQRLITQRLLRIVFATSIVRNIAERLQSMVVPRGEAAIDEPTRGALGLAGAEIGPGLSIARIVHLVTTKGCQLTIII
jgi:hypothetical protein